MPTCEGTILRQKIMLITISNMVFIKEGRQINWLRAHVFIITISGKNSKQTLKYLNGILEPIDKLIVQPSNQQTMI